MQQFDLDSRLNYRNLYERYLKKLDINGDEATTFCPFHNDSGRPNFTVNLRTGQYNCFACGVSGNAVKFVAEMEHIDTKEAYKKLAREAGYDPDTEKQRKKHPGSIEEYSEMKKLPIQFLTDLGLRNVVIKGGKIAGLEIPYYDENGNELFTRCRNEKGFRWSKGAKAKEALYGLWKLEIAKKAGYVVVVEGESDTHTLWLHNIPAVGIPGAGTVSKEHVQWLMDIPLLYISHEPDSGGNTFTNELYSVLAEMEYKGTVKELMLPEGVKDPSALHMINPSRFEETWQEIIGSAREIDIYSHGKPKPISDSPVNLICPAGFTFSDSGIYTWITKRDESIQVCVSKVPVLLSKRLKSIDTGQEKIEICFKRDGKWHHEAFERSTVFTTRGITSLADIGITVTSENAKYLVKFLGDLEACNIDALPISKCTAQLGWYGKNFIPFTGDVIVDVDRQTRRWVDAYTASGTLEEWVSQIDPMRQNPYFRFVLAAGFAAPLLYILGHRVFFVHIWGDSRGGKTAALKAALSVWGDPDALMVSFNATNVGLERLAGLFNDLPMGIDEEQAVDSRGARMKENKRSFVETLIYILSLGVGKIRGNKQGGLQSYRTWRTIALTTGEEPLSSMAGNTGVRTRALEINGLPFENEEDLARRCHGIVKDVHGTAGPEFINRLMLADLMEIKAIYEEFCSGFTQSFPRKINSHITAVSVVCTANYLADIWLFGMDKGKSLSESIELGRAIIGRLEDEQSADVVERAYEFVKNWVVSNGLKFTPDSPPPRYGYNAWLLKEEGDHVYIFPAYLKKALEDEGFGYRKIIKGFAQRGYIEAPDGEDRHQVLKKIDGKPVRLIKLLFIENQEPMKESIDDFFDGL